MKGSNQEAMRLDTRHGYGTTSRGCRVRRWAQLALVSAATSMLVVGAWRRVVDHAPQPAVLAIPTVLSVSGNRCHASEIIDRARFLAGGTFVTNVSRIRIHPGLPEYEFKVVARRFDTADLYTAEWIEVRKLGQAPILQVLGTIPEQQAFSRNTVIAEDMNFDGYRDLKLLNWAGAWNAGYLHWLFDTNTGLFRRCDKLMGLSHPWPDTKTQTIVAHWESGAPGNFYEKAQFKWENGHLVLVWEQTQDMIATPTRDFLRRLFKMPEAAPKFLRVTKARRAGTMRVIEKKVIRAVNKG